ncbi:MAG: hypothetical protein ACK5LV_02425 [Lachnospirales bacterium]
MCYNQWFQIGIIALITIVVLYFIEKSSYKKDNKNIIYKKLLDKIGVSFEIVNKYVYLKKNNRDDEEVTKCVADYKNSLNDLYYFYENYRLVLSKNKPLQEEFKELEEIISSWYTLDDVSYKNEINKNSLKKSRKVLQRIVKIVA